MAQDRFLVGILVAIGVLVVAAVGLFFARPGDQSYGPEESPEGVMRNYALALQQGDYEKAYSYLAEEPHKPDFEDFKFIFLSSSNDVSNVGLQIGAVRSLDGEATVEVTVLYAGSGPFDRGWRQGDTALLLREAGAWKVRRMPYPFWGWNWYEDERPVEIRPLPAGAD